jgi:hypothetical protein
MDKPKLREVEVPFTQEEMEEAFIPISLARDKRNYEKFKTPIGKRLVGTI